MNFQQFQTKDYLIDPEQQMQSIYGFFFGVEEVRINERLIVFANIIRVENLLSWFWINPKNGKMYAGCLNSPTLFNLTNPEDIKKTVQGGLNFIKENARAVIEAVLSENEEGNV